MPYMILSMTIEVAKVEIKPYKTASIFPNTGHPRMMTNKSITMVTSPSERCGKIALMDIVRKSVPPVEEPLI